MEGGFNFTKMGLISAFFGTTDYHNALKRYGVDPYSLPANLNSAVASYTSQQHERNVSSLGFNYTRYVTLKDQLGSAAALVAICINGPTRVALILSEDEVSSRMKSAALIWTSEGPDASLDTKIIETIMNSGHMSPEFAYAFKSLF